MSVKRKIIEEVSIVTMHKEDLDHLIQAAGYTYLGGMSNQVYLQRERREILKIAAYDDNNFLSYKWADFRRCLETSKVYASKGLMPEVFEVGDNFAGTGYPYLKECYIEGENLSTAYLADPHVWKSQFAEEIHRIDTQIISGPTYTITDTWTNKLTWLSRPAGYTSIYQRVQEAGEWLATHIQQGYRLHGAVQFGNMVVGMNEQGTQHITLIDWEMSEIMPLGYEFTMLYTFLPDPELRVEEHLKASYRTLRPLATIWQALAPILVADLAISSEEFKNSVLFRAGSGWLTKLESALERDDHYWITYWTRKLTDLTNGTYFTLLPYPELEVNSNKCEGKQYTTIN